jgi:hypothetical protein
MIDKLISYPISIYLYTIKMLNQTFLIAAHIKFHSSYLKKDNEIVMRCWFSHDQIKNGILGKKYI